MAGGGEGCASVDYDMAALDLWFHRLLTLVSGCGWISERITVTEHLVLGPVPRAVCWIDISFAQYSLYC